MQTLWHQLLNRKINHISGKDIEKVEKMPTQNWFCCLTLHFDDKLVLFWQILSKYKQMRKVSFSLRGNTDLTGSFLFFQSAFIESKNNLKEGWQRE